MKKTSNVLIIFFLLLLSPAAIGAILCSSFKPQGDCNAPCNGSCTYYTFKDSSITKTIDSMVFDLSVFIPGGNYCDLEAEDELSAWMNQIPFTLGPHYIHVLPYNATLKYKIYTKHSKSGGACP